MGDESHAVEYVFYVGEPIGTVSLWERRGEEFERPIVANTRGETAWFSSDPDETNRDRHDPSAAFWEALRQITADENPIDVRDCPWYERQIIHSAINMIEQESVTRDLIMLLEDAQEDSDK